MRLSIYLLAFVSLLSGCGSDAPSQDIASPQDFDAVKLCLEESAKLGISVSKSECEALEKDFNAEQPARDAKERKHVLALKGLGQYDLNDAVTCRVAASMVSFPLKGQGLKFASENAHDVSSFWALAAQQKAPETTWSDLTAKNKLSAYIQDKKEGYMEFSMNEYHDCAGRYALALLSQIELPDE